MPLHRTVVGDVADREGRPGGAVSAFALDTGGVTATVWDYGAHLVSVRCPDRLGEVGEIVLGHDTLADYDRPDRAGFCGATVGRYANRIAEGRFTLDGQRYELATNAGPHHLHGGTVGFDQHIWRAASTGSEHEPQVTMRLERPDGDEGFPGAVTVTVRFTMSAATTVDDAAVLAIDYEATTDAPTVINLTNHAYWNLAGGGKVLDHQLMVAADHVLLADDTGLSLDQPPSPVAGTRHDFRILRRLGGAAFGPGYDECMVLSGGAPAAVLVDPASGRRLTLETDQPGLQLYTANFIPDPHTAVCLEAQHFPDSPNRPDFPSTVLRPGDVFRSTTRHTFGAVPAVD